MEHTVFMDADSAMGLAARRRPLLRLAAVGVALALSAGALAGCGASTTKPAKSTTSSSSSSKTSSSKSSASSKSSSTTSKSSSTTSKTSSATSKTSSSTSKTSSATTGSQYAQYYKANGSATLTSAPLTIDMGNFFFKPNTLTVAKGTKVTLVLKNSSTIPHNFSLDAFHVSTTVNPGKTGKATFTASAAGTYYFYCNIPGHAQSGMVGKLVVK